MIEHEDAYITDCNISPVHDRMDRLVAVSDKWEESKKREETFRRDDRYL